MSPQAGVLLADLPLQPMAPDSSSANSSSPAWRHPCPPSVFAAGDTACTKGMFMPASFRRIATAQEGYLYLPEHACVVFVLAGGPCWSPPPQAAEPPECRGLVFIAVHDGPYIQSVRGRGLPNACPGCD
jgi:hypothetical protein